MALEIPTTQQISDQNISRFESALGQDVPLNEKAFLRVLAVIEALTATGLYKFAAERARQNLAISASGQWLDLIGNEFSTPRKLAESTVLTITLPALTGTVIPATASFVGASNGVRYFVDASVIAAAGVATISVTAENQGTIGNLSVSDTLTIVSPIAGAEQTATVSSVDTTGADEETDTVYRPRVLFAIRATTGGANATDHKIWAEEVAGVKRAFPFAGLPVDDPGTSYPGDRTVYVECDASIDPDGIAPTSLLDSVRDAINNDPETGRSRPVLGLTDDTLYVEPITRSAFDITLNNLVSPSGLDATVRSEIESALTSYFGNLVTYVEGVDLVSDRNDQVTSLTISQIIQQVLDVYGASAEDVTFEVSAVSYDIYQLTAGELAKFGSITYAVV